MNEVSPREPLLAPQHRQDLPHEERGEDECGAGELHGREPVPSEPVAEEGGEDGLGGEYDRRSRRRYALLNGGLDVESPGRGSEAGEGDGEEDLPRRRHHRLEEWPHQGEQDRHREHLGEREGASGVLAGVTGEKCNVHAQGDGAHHRERVPYPDPGGALSREKHHAREAQENSGEGVPREVDLEEEESGQRGENHEEAGDEPRVGRRRIQEAKGLEEIPRTEDQPYPRAYQQRPARHPEKEWGEGDASERETQGQKREYPVGRDRILHHYESPTPDRRYPDQEQGVGPGSKCASVLHQERILAAPPRGSQGLPPTIHGATVDPWVVCVCRSACEADGSNLPVSSRRGRAREPGVREASDPDLQRAGRARRALPRGVPLRLRGDRLRLPRRLRLGPAQGMHPSGARPGAGVPSPTTARGTTSASSRSAASGAGP